MSQRSFSPRALACLAALSSLPVWAQTTSSNDVVVVAPRVIEPLAAVMPSTSVLTREDIEKFPHADLYEVLRGQVGLELTRTGGPGNPISVYARGASSAQTLILVDGIPFSSQGAIGAISPLEVIPVQQVERIEILRGNASALYGAGAVGGVIQIFTRTATAGAEGPQASLEWGARGSRQAHVGYGVRQGDTRYSIAVGENRSNGIEALSHAKYPNVNPGPNGFQNQSLNINASHQFSRDSKLSLNYLGSGIKAEFDNTFGLPSDVWENKTRAAMLGVLWEQRVNEGWQTRLSLSKSLNDQNTFTNGQANASYGFLKTEHQQFRWSNDWALNASNVLSLNYTLVDASIASEHGGGYPEVPVYVNQSNHAQKLHAGLNSQWDRWNFQASVGHENVVGGSQGNTFLLGGGYQLGRGYKLTMTRSSALLTPTLGQLYDVSFGGNLALKPEWSHSTEAGLQFSSEKVNWRLLAFQVRYDNLIAAGNNLVSDPVWAAQYIYQLENIEKSKNSGLEWSYSRRMGAWFAGMQFTHQTPVNVDSAVEVKNKSRNWGSLQLGYDIDARTALHGKLFATSMRRTYDPLTFQVVDTAGYAVADISLKRKIDRELTATAGINNATNATYFHLAGYNNLPRTLYVALRYQSTP